MTASMTCTYPNGCRNITADPTGRCHMHPVGSEWSAAAPTAVNGLPPRLSIEQNSAVLAANAESWEPGQVHPTGGYDDIIETGDGSEYQRNGSLHRTDGPAKVDSNGRAVTYALMGEEVADGKEGSVVERDLRQLGAAPEDVVRWMEWDGHIASGLITARITADEADDAYEDGARGVEATVAHALAARAEDGAVPCEAPEPVDCGRVTTSESGLCQDHEDDPTAPAAVTPSKLVAPTMPQQASAPEMEAARQHYIPTSPEFQRNLAVMDACRMSKKPVILWGEPGTGKTALIEALAANRGMDVEVLVGSQMDPTDVAGLPMGVRRPDGVLVTEQGMPHWAQRVFDNQAEGKPTVLFFDEASNTPPATQSSILTLLQSRTVQGRKLPDDCWIVAAANPMDSAADGWQMSAPMANRMMHLDWDPPTSDWYEGMTLAWGKEASPRERTERAKIVAFCRSYPQMVHQRPESETEQSGAWPSRRSWDNLADTLQYVDDPQARLVVMQGFVGEGATTQMAHWENSLDLPEPQAVLDDPEAVDWEGSSADRQYAILYGSLGMSASNDDNGESNFPKAIKVFEEAGRRGATDVAATIVPDLIRNAPKGTPFPKSLLPIFGEALKAAKVL